DVQSSYRNQSLFFQRLRHTREHLGNRLDRPSSLRVRRSGRELEDCRSILPESISEAANRQRPRRGLDTLLRDGWQEAVRQGVPRPTEQDCVRYLLLAAARRAPSPPLDGRQARKLIRAALYSTPYDGDTRGEEPDLATHAEVVARALKAMWPHLNDTSDL